jgi:hypothetical protein
MHAFLFSYPFSNCGLHAIPACFSFSAQFMYPRSASPSGGISKIIGHSKALWLLAHFVLPRALHLWDGAITAQNMRRTSVYAAPVGAA